MGAGALGAYLILHYYQNCEFKNNGLIQCSRSLQDVLTGLVPVHMHTQLEPGQLDYDTVLEHWYYQIIMYMIPSRIDTIELPSLARVSLYPRFATW